MKILKLTLVLFFIALSLPAQATTSIITYHGTIYVDDRAFSGTGYFKVAIITASGRTIWSNDGTSVGGSQPTGDFDVTVSDGDYTILLGSSDLMNTIDASIFNSSETLYLRTWFDDGSAGFAKLDPDIRITSAIYAINAQTLQGYEPDDFMGGDNTITSASITDGTIAAADIASGAVTTDKASFFSNSGKSFSLGNASDSNVNLIASIGSATNPAIRYNTTTDQWELSNNGSTYTAISTGFSGGGSDIGDILGVTAGSGLSGGGLSGSVTLTLNQAFSPTWTGSHTFNNDVAIAGTAARAIQMGRNSTSDTAGNTLTVAAGGATLLATNKAGGDLVLASGISTGFAGSNIYLKTAGGGGMGTADASLSTRMTITNAGYVGIGVTPNNYFQVLDLINFDNNNNVFLGQDAGKLYSSGNYNTAVGNRSYDDIATGSNNTAVGYNTLTANTGGSDNTAIGYASQSATIGGSDNTSVGYLALALNTSGNYNTAVGNAALYSMTGANHKNTAFGGSALFSSTAGDNNTAVGYQALLWSTGDNNIGIGYQSGANQAAGSNNILIGYQVDAPSTTGSNQLSLGNLIYATGLDGTGSNISAGLVGIKVKDPSDTLDIDGTLRIRTQSATSTDEGTGAMQTLTLTPDHGTIKLNCQDVTGNTITLSEASAQDGQIIKIIAVGTQTCTFNDSAAVQETNAGGTVNLGQWDVIEFTYVTDRWVETNQLDN